jgi:hypothetical protein
MPEALNKNSNSLVFTGKNPDNRPLITRTSNAEIEKTDKEREEARRKAEETNNNPVVSSLAGHVRAAMTAAEFARTTVSERILSSLRQREGEYEADVLKLIKESNGTEVFMLLTDTKCRALEAWLIDIMLPSGERPWAIEPTPVPDLPQNIIRKASDMFVEDYFVKATAEAAQAGMRYEESMFNQEHFEEEAEKFKKVLLKRIQERAQEDADSLETHIDDELREGNWYKELADFIYDFATYPTAFMEGPIYRRRSVLAWEPVQGEARSELRVIEKVVKEYERIAPYDIWPSPGSKSIQDGNLCVRRRYRRSDLEALRGVEGYDSDIIDTVLDLYKNGYREYFAYDTEYQDLHDRENEYQDPEGNIDLIKFWGNVQGMMLREWGLTMEQVPDPYREYPVIAYMVGNYVIGAKLNPHPLGRRNIYSASFRKKNDSVWGKSLPELMRDVQNVCNSAARAICNNAAIASGPQVWQYVDLIPAACERTDLYPWKIWEFSSENTKNNGQRPMEFYQPPLVVSQLLEIYDYFQKQGGEVSGIPNYIYGNEDVGGAGETASGLSMLMNAAAKGLRNAAKNIDDGVIAPSIEEHWLNIMLTRPDLAKGDTKINARASDYLIQQEALHMRRKELLDATNNPTDMQIIGIGGRAELLRENVKALKMNIEKIIPTREDMISTQVDQQMQAVIEKISQELNMPPEQIMAILQSPSSQLPQRSQQQSPTTRAVDAAGNLPAGQEVRQFNQ